MSSIHKSLLVSTVLAGSLIGLTSYNDVQADDEFPGDPEPVCEELPVTERKQLLTETALDREIPPEILKAIAMRESSMNQCTSDGKPTYNLSDDDGGVGIMQITIEEGQTINGREIDFDRLGYDTAYNIEAGADMLLEKLRLVPRINDMRRDILEHWYFAVLAYNGLSVRNDANQYDDPWGNEDTYQSKIFAKINTHSMISIDPIPPYNTHYQPGSTIIRFDSTQKEWDVFTPSSQMFDAGDEAIVMNESTDPHTNNFTRLREGGNTQSRILDRFPYYTDVTITGEPVYTDANRDNHFLWYPVEAGGQTGYLASSNLRVPRALDFDTWGDESVPEVGLDKVWTIELNAPADPDSVNPRNVYLQDEDGLGVFAEVELADEQTITVTPRAGLTPDTGYTLHVQELVTKDGTTLDANIEKHFRTEAAGD
ncbi:transglycosylase SLT domain-containing protein [Salisediminibacterium selenitireducens]|uniref:Lytic transglycosylase catalytic n=1 Tax=Bacillus selenitireducens (strain ATCC 700615 / DSM 15326 / MLS10) TaxID=439292 RepID=D6Y0I8_BACIE|nr:transglycosylase SLT domain-containing protein [Salisediminibacterium selenitireducens]ADI00556.1 Lytic transglycosylase catalytic [[Bacillus] selenitireducens MLS10]